MSGWSVLLDVGLVVVLVGALAYGWHSGLLRTAAGLAGLAAGGVAAFFAMPWVGGIVDRPMWRAAAVVLTAALLLSVGAVVGTALGRLLNRGARAIRLGWLDRTLGAIGNLVAAAFAIALVASGVASMGVPALTPVVAGSWVVRGIDAVTPTPARAALAEIRAATFGGAIPWLGEVIGGPTEAPAPPTGELDDADLVAAGASVVRISGLAFRCGVSMSGSGFVIAPDRVVTNAHVVAGVPEPVVEAPGRIPLPGRVVAIDRDADLALIAVDGLGVEPLDLAANPPTGTDAAIGGYPFGGPYELRAARFLETGPLAIDEDGVRSTRDVTTLAAKVDHGNSGGPVLTLDGDVGAIVFAKSETVPDVGYAIPASTLAPLAARASALVDAVDVGSCVR
ncbi:MarP family serine protease [Agromyces protaetiae]|uniref:MarP family serine protease n=1 Tax=Agromyces protaetiae TaxID=2509455 RepID=A0A4P6FRW8_9MICO|nr:MarP family serine protease [Agromyces protaetiae]QAY73278.1 MarP family serine protease [Agromyces protaetiae]